MKKQESKKKEGEEESKPYLVFQFCKDKCCKCNYCGYHWGPGALDSLQGQPASWTITPLKKGRMTTLYTTDSVRASLLLKYDTYFARLSVGQPSTWKCDQRTADLYCLGQWLIDELTQLGCPDEDRRHQQWYFNRKTRAEEDVFAIAAKTVNDFLEGKIDKYKGR